MYKIDQDTPPPPTALASEIAQRTAIKADQAVAATQSAVNQTADAVNEGLDNLGESGTSALTRAAAKADALANKGMEQARRAGSAVREQAQVTGDRTVEYIRQEPVKAVLMAAAAGAVVALLLGRRGH
ncbi:MAG: hypothetical protein KBF63_13995 [Rhodoferax sp.]|nr:hypothetical protein [Rhodoferax sp.]MBP9930388.1 hypothetical protein [Rhodoferax sp.]HQZ06784.1 hypothetical protein [Burkholderiaceae bacterium]